VVVARNSPGSNPEALIKSLLSTETRLETEARSHYEQLLASTLRIETPDQAVNQQLAWAQIALDQAWVCNEVLGCGLVAGYGPSRNARRPQYAWFFAGDALIAVEALVSSGDYERAQQALAFIAKYQDARTGMIWHEISQSADPADWATRYPYMFVHVDITFQYLTAVERYVSAAGTRHSCSRTGAGSKQRSVIAHRCSMQTMAFPASLPVKKGAMNRTG
jgi:glycogen debranching enzyme